MMYRKVEFMSTKSKQQSNNGLESLPSKLPSKTSSEEEKEAEAEQLLQEARQRRGNECQAEIQRVLEEYRCQMVPTVTIEGGQVRQNITIVPSG